MFKPLSSELNGFIGGVESVNSELSMLQVIVFLVDGCVYAYVCNIC